MTNSESHRQFYLNAAGIRMWYAKRALPGAAPSPEYSFGEEPEPETAGPQAGNVIPPALSVKADKRPQRPSVDLQSLMTEPSASAKADSAREVREDNPSVAQSAVAAKTSDLSTTIEAEVESPATSDSKLSISAHLGIWASEHYVLISQWSDTASERLQENLAQNVLGALNQSEIAASQRLQWPVFRNTNIPGNSIRDFQGVLAGLLSPYRERSLILLGVLGDVPETERGSCLEPLQRFVGLDFKQSLAEISSSARYKRELWTALKSRYSL